MLCCVSRKASASPNNEINQNLQNNQNNKKSILNSVPSSSSSGFSSSSFDSSQIYDSSLTSGFTTSSSSCDTSGYSSNTRVYANSSSESFSTASQLTDNFIQKDHFLAHSNVFHPVADSSSGRKGFPPEPPKRLVSFSPTAKPSNDEVSQDSSVEKSSVKDEPTELLPCAICARTFKPQSLEKHTRICERAAVKKRKPFDSAKQRIQGTELAEFLPKETIKRKSSQSEDRANSNVDKGSWQQTRDELRRAIRAARGETVNPTPQRQVVPTCNVTVGVPTRPNEKGICPTCERQFSIKSYERHVAWCKERATRVPMSTATNIAKERLEARMKYRAPALKNRRVTTREKYSPLSAMNLTSKTNNTTLPSQRAKETVSTPSCNNKGGNENTTSTSQSQKSTVTGRRSGQGREGISSGPMKSRLSDRSSSGSCKDYDPFLIAERQMNELLSDTCSDQSLTDSSSNHRGSLSPSLSHFPLSHSSAFVKYPDSVTLQNQKVPEKRVSLIAPPTEFDDLATDFSSDSTETNSISREINGACDSNSRARDNSCENNDKRKNSRDHVLGRRVIIDKSKALGTSETVDDSASIRSSFGNSHTNEKARKLFERTTPKVSRSNSVRIISSLKVPESKSNNSVKSSSNKNDTSRNNRNNNYASLSGSNVSLSSIVSSEIDAKRSNSMFDELASSFEDDISGIYPSLRSLLKNDSLSVTSPIQSNDPRNGQISDDEFSSPDSYKRQEHNKLSADSAYSSLNRKYSNHGRSTNDMAGRHDEDSPLRRREVDVSSVVRSKMSKFCHECGSKFPDTAKFCCECGIRRLAL